MDSLLTTQLSWEFILTQEHDLGRPGCCGHAIHSTHSMCSQRGAACSPVTSIELAQAKAAKRERKQAKQKAKEAARKATEDAGRTARAAKRFIHGEA